ISCQFRHRWRQPLYFSGVFFAPWNVSKTGKMMLQTMPTAWRASVSMEDELTRLRKGDLEALAGLIEQYQTSLYRYLLRLVHEPATAEDLFQQTWMRVAEKIRKYDPKRSFDNWLFTVPATWLSTICVATGRRALMSRCPQASRAWN